ncbi:stage II sporulation protein M [Cylindrospermopsis raciborskii CHAB3438]|uniref:stage II sporulation protein M n=1 Tax=Cylindrospermopsis raciborskii TaxID=77022 RepID=UPI001F0F949B|nr:stage II sporulation protein M [Cylindrospermopsis raciborskii]MCH4904273.1 stage II sporulation protein M [Cylindrospermopsis raciborskii CHAB3438]
MNIKRWISTREENWQRLDSLLSKIERKRLKSLKSSEIRELASLYRSITADLARARTYNVSRTLFQSLQLLATRAYTQIYQGSRKQEWEGVIQFYRWGFPAIVQQTFPYIIAATGLFILGMLVGWWYSWQDPKFMSLLIPESLISQVRDQGELWMGSIVGIEPLASSNIMVNNISVSFSAVAGGITGGIFTIYILVFNGLLIGSIATLVAENNLAYPFWAFVFPHGALELPAIFFAGGAGLLLGRGILFPGKYLRLEAIKYYSSLAAQLVFGIVPLLIIAGIIEGFFSPNPIIPDPVKYLVGLAIFILLVMYCNRK